MLNDALGSVVVVVASVLFYVRPLPPDSPCNWQCYVDPSLTLVMVAIIVSSAVPLVKETSRILLQMSPPDLDVSMISEYKRSLCILFFYLGIVKVYASSPLLTFAVEDVCRLPGVLSVHEVHVWELARDRNVASMHVKLTSDLESSEGEIRRLHVLIREVFHSLGVHSVTLQMEFADEDMDNSHCTTPCISYDCLKQSCCPADPKTQNHTDLHKSNDYHFSGEVSVVLADGKNEEERKQSESTPL